MTDEPTSNRNEKLLFQIGIPEVNDYNSLEINRILIRCKNCLCKKCRSSPNTISAGYDTSIFLFSPNSDERWAGIDLRWRLNYQNIQQLYNSWQIQSQSKSNSVHICSGKYMSCGHVDTAYFANSTGYAGLYYTNRRSDFRNGTNLWRQSRTPRSERGARSKL